MTRSLHKGPILKTVRNVARPIGKSGKKSGPLAAPNRPLPSTGRDVDETRRLSRSQVWFGVTLAAGLVIAAGFGSQLLSGLAGVAPSPAGELATTFVGSETCAGCHIAQAELWRNSQHKQA